MTQPNATTAYRAYKTPEQRHAKVFPRYFGSRRTEKGIRFVNDHKASVANGTHKRKEFVGPTRPVASPSAMTQDKKAQLATYMAEIAGEAA